MPASTRWKIRTLLSAAVLAGISSPSFAWFQDHGASAEPEADVGDPAAEARLLSNTRQLTFEGRRAGEGYFNHDGSLMVFQSEREPDNPFFQIYLMDLETGDVDRISPGHGKTTCAWVFPDDRRVLFASTHDDPEARAKQKAELDLRAEGKQKRYSWDYDENYELYVADRKTGEMARLTDARGYDAEGAVSPDGKRVVFASNRHAYSEPLSDEDAEAFEIDKSLMLDLYIMNADGSDVRRLTTARGYDGGPFFSADGKKICFRRFSEDGVTAEIYVMNADGTGERQITRLGAMSWAPYFHPSGEYLIFMTNRHGFGNFETYIVDAAGEHEPVRVTHTPKFDGLPVFSPNGAKLSWTSQRTPTGETQIFLADWNHAEARSLLGLAGKREDGARQVENPIRAAAASPRTSPEISAADLHAHVVQLASDEFEGRLAGTEGERLATAYVAACFERLGLEPAGDDGTYFDEFDFTAGVATGPDNALALQSEDGAPTRSFEVDEDWRPLAYSSVGVVEPAEIVFAGYGIVAPQGDGSEEYDSFVHLDVTDRWVIVLRYMPEDFSPERRQQVAKYTGLRYKAMIVRDKGARGMIVVSGPNSKVKNQLVKMSFDASSAGGSLAAVSITDQAAERMLASAGKSLKELQDALDSGDPVMGFAIEGVKLAAKIDIERVQRTGRNVLARLPAARGGSDEPTLTIGAHVDHLGRGIGSGSLARDDEKGDIHYGADDNASGTAGLLEIAEYYANLKEKGKLDLKRDVIFAAWSGEELGLLGANHYVAELGEALGDEANVRPAVAAYLNMDMIGRLTETLVVQGVGSSTVWPKEIERRNVPVGLNIVATDDSYLPTDATAFYLKGVPILACFTGSHEDYHTPRDTADKLNYEGIARIAKFMGLVGRSLATTADEPDYQQVEKPEDRAPRAGLRAYLGTIPDYGQGEAPGLKLSGVANGGPADKAGLKGGDVIVELAGRKIENIYDYTYAIEAVKIGQEVEIVVVRNGERLTLEITPGSRE